MSSCIHLRKMGMPPARAGGIGENRSVASEDLHCEMGRPPARAGGAAL
jgi:hypothetical protein